MCGQIIALLIPSNQRAKRSGGKPETRTPPAPAIASGAKMAPLPSLVATLDAVTVASIWSPWRPRPAKLHRLYPMHARVIGWRPFAAAMRSSHPPARSSKRSALSPVFSGSRRSRKAAKSAFGPGPPVRRRTAHATLASAFRSSCAPDSRIDIQSARRSELTRSPANQLRSAASIRARRCRQPSGPRSSQSSRAPKRPATLASRAA